MKRSRFSGVVLSVLGAGLCLASRTSSSATTNQPTGKLSFTWPRSIDQIPINVGDQPCDPLFPFGYGLTY